MKVYGNIELEGELKNVRFEPLPIDVVTEPPVADTDQVDNTENKEGVE